MLESLSVLMRWARALGSERMAWALRRLHCPVPPQALVLEVGSGGNPYPRANVLLDAYEATRERHWVPLKADRPTVLGFVECLPFRDHAFDFVIASHVLEHSAHPERFLSELQRVAKAGYIETPDAFMERVNPYQDHRLEVTTREGRLVIRKKPGWRADPEIVELYEHRAKPFIAGALIPARPFEFHVRYYWQSRIEFAVINADTDAGWAPPEANPGTHAATAGTGWRGLALNGLRTLLSQTRRNRSISLPELLRCPGCFKTTLSRQESSFVCQGCGTEYPFQNGIPALFPGKSG
jgi:SAM-dependent methyltransferase